jgi:hypothetical protein
MGVPMNKLLLLAVAFSATAAGAQTYDFSYLDSSTSNELTGELSGYISGGTFYFTGVNWLKVNGTALSSATYLNSTDAYYGVGPGPAQAKLDNSYLDFEISDGPLGSASEIALFAVGDNAASILGTPSFGATINYGGTNNFENFNAANYSATVNGAVPEPANWALMLGGFGLVGGAMRLRRRSVVFA